MIIVALQLVLAAVLGIAAVGKFLDSGGSHRAVSEFGVPRRLVTPIVTALPAFEMTVAVLILPGATARWAALGAAILMVVFVGAIAWNLRKGRRPDCHCFGQMHSSPAGPSTLVRNGGFAVMAGLIAWHGSPGPVAWFSGLAEMAQIVVVFGTAILLLLGAQVWLSSQLRHQNQRMLEIMEEGGGALPVIDASPSAIQAPRRARSAPAFDLPTTDGRRLTLQKVLSRGKPVLLLFVDPACGPCRELVPDIHEWHRRFGDEITVVLISRGDPITNLRKFGDLAVALQDDREIYDLYDVEGTPTGVLVSRDGLIREPYAPGRAEIRELVMRAMQGTPGPDKGRATNAAGNVGAEPELRLAQAPTPGTAGTRLPLPDLDGRYVGIDDLRGERIILLFFNPTCVFCQRMLPEMREWESDAGAALSRLLIVSTGTAEDHRDLGLRSRIVLDDGFLTGRDYGATGTPSAIILNADGRVASGIASGPDDVIDLLYEEIEAAAGVPG